MIIFKQYLRPTPTQKPSFQTPMSNSIELSQEDLAAILGIGDGRDSVTFNHNETMVNAVEISESSMVNRGVRSWRELCETDRAYLDRGLETLVQFYEQKELGTHPYFEWLRSRPVDLSSIWLLFHNLQYVTGSIVRWLSTTLTRLNDPVISCLLVEQLYDELGNGKPERVHRVLFDRLYQALTPWKPEAITSGKIDAFTASIPGLKLKQGFESYYTAQDPHLAVGSLLSGEICAYKLDQCIHEQMTRTQAISAHNLTWLTMHLTVEADHAGYSTILARRLDQLGVPRNQVGLMAQSVWEICMRFLHEVHQLNLELLSV